MWLVKRGRRVGLFIGTFSFFLLVLTLAIRSGKTSSEGLMIPPECLDLGEVWRQPDFRCNLPVQNPTAVDADILDFATSCNCVSIEPRSLQVPAGQQATIRLKLDLTRSTINQGVTPIEDFRAEIFPRIKGRSIYHTGWTVRARVRRALTFTPPVADFGDNLIRGKIHPPRNVIAHANVGLGGLTATCDPKQALVNVIRLADSPEEYQLTLQLRAKDARWHPELQYHVQSLDARRHADPATSTACHRTCKGRCPGYTLDGRIRCLPHRYH